jgi:hypothetical protein
LEVGLLQIIEFIIDGVYILGIMGILAGLFARKEDRTRLLIALLGFLVLPFLVVSYTNLRPTFMTMVRNTIIQIVSTNQVFNNFSTRLNRESIQSLLIDSPFNNYVIDILYYIGMFLYGALITSAIMITSAVSSFLESVWKLITKR